MNFDPSVITNFIIDKISRYKMPSLSINIVKEDEIIYSRGFGFRDLKRGIPATAKTIYGIGSITKSFTALSIMKLYEDGKIDLNDPISKYLPLDLVIKDKKITIHHLLTHSSGIPAMAYAEALLRGYFETSDIWLPFSYSDDVVDYMANASEWAVVEPGKRFFYLNEGYVLLGKIIEKVSNFNYREFVKNNILKPLKMNDSFFIGEEVHGKEVAKPYIICSDGSKKEASVPGGILADGGIMSTSEDLAKYITMLINRGRYNGESIISKEGIELMENPYIKIPWQVYGGDSYGYGLIIHPNFIGERLIEHGGSLLVYTAFIGYIPRVKVGVAILANSSGYPLFNIGTYVLAYMLGKSPNELPNIRYDKLLDKLVGEYRGYKGNIIFSIERNGDSLLLIYKDKYSHQIQGLMLQEYDGEKALFITPYRGGKMEVEFYIKDNRVELIYDRYRLIKK